MGRRLAPSLANLGGPLFLVASLWMALDLAIVCLGGCVSSDIAARVITWAIPAYPLYLLPGATTMLTAWIICLSLRRRAGWRG